MSAGPVIVIIVFVLLIGSAFGSTLLWIISAIAMVALVVLIAIMARADRFFGPKVVVDDISRKLGSYGTDASRRRDMVAVVPVVPADEVEEAPSRVPPPREGEIPTDHPASSTPRES